MNIALEQLKQIMPNGKDRLEKFVQPLNEWMPKYGINTPARIAAFIAQLAHESGEFRYMKELASGLAYDKREDLGNTLPEAIAIARNNRTSPGCFYRGHGPIQITGYTNHLLASKSIWKDNRGVLTPTLFETPKWGVASACWFWGEFKKLNDEADRGDFLTITRRINGGTNGLKDREHYWAKAKEVFKVKDTPSKET